MNTKRIVDFLKRVWAYCTDRETKIAFVSGVSAIIFYIILTKFLGCEGW